VGEGDCEGGCDGDCDWNSSGTGGRAGRACPPAGRGIVTIGLLGAPKTGMGCGSCAGSAGASFCVDSGGMSPNCMDSSSRGFGRSLSGTAPDILLLDILM
jgi:hypothetical protein